MERTYCFCEDSKKFSTQLADTQAALEAAQAVVEAAKDYINAEGQKAL